MSGTAHQPLPRGSRWRRVRLYVLLGLLMLLVLHVGLDLMAGNRVNAARARLEPRVGSLSVQRLAPPPVPAEENRARLVRAATALTVPPTPEATRGIAALGAPREVGAVPDVVRAYVTANQPALKLSAEFGTRQESDWEVDYLTGSNMPRLLEIRMLGHVLMLSALLELEAGRVDEASKHVANGLAVSASLRQEPNLITQLVRMAIASRQIDAVQRLVAHPGPSRTALELLAARLAENRAPSPMAVGLAGEVRLIDASFAAAEAGRSDGFTDEPRVLSSSNPILARIGRPLTRFQRAAYLQRMEAILDSQAGPKPRQALPRESDSFLARQFMPGVTAGLDRALTAEDDHDRDLAAAETAVALRRYELDRGEYPAELTALTPHYLAMLPIDPFTGQPPTYVREGTGFTLTTDPSDQRRSELRPTPVWTVR